MTRFLIRIKRKGVGEKAGSTMTCDSSQAFGVSYLASVYKSCRLGPEAIDTYQLFHIFSSVETAMEVQLQGLGLGRTHL